MFYSKWKLIDSKKKSTSKAQVMQEGFLGANITVFTCMCVGKTGKEDVEDPSFTTLQMYKIN